MSVPEKLAGASSLTAYFCMEYAIDAKLPIYAGGLGVLAGDHLKACNDEGIPIVGIGIFYHRGYFTQRFDPDGRQIEHYPKINPTRAGLKLVTDEHGKPLYTTVPIEGKEILAKAYKIPIGEVPLYLLSTDVPENSTEDRLITAYLYGAKDPEDRQTRIRQEIVLGIGGFRLLNKLGISPSVYHMNEGHSAFLTLARIETLIQEGCLSLEEARQQVRRNQIFTTHTPVPAGNDVFTAELISSQLAHYPRVLGEENFAQLAATANHVPDSPPDTWSQAHFAISNSAVTTAVSRRHSETTTVMWQLDSLGLETMAYVTNGVHISWMDKAIAEFIDPDQQAFKEEHKYPAYIKKRLRDPDLDQLRVLRNTERRGLIDFVNNLDNDARFNPDVLTIGFARRGTPYKRLGLLFRDPERLTKIVSDSERPVQIVLASKAAPQEDAGKTMIQNIINTIKGHPVLRRRVCFIGDYNYEIARRVVVGSDLWVNTPQKPLEASGTSGMKSAMNGGRQWSVDDGWMCEVPKKLYLKIEDDLNPDTVSARMYAMLEGQIKDEFYDDKNRPLSNYWLQKVIESMTFIIPRFTAARMSNEYDSRFYQPLSEHSSVPILIS